MAIELNPAFCEKAFPKNRNDELQFGVIFTF